MTSFGRSPHAFSLYSALLLVTTASTRLPAQSPTRAGPAPDTFWKTTTPAEDPALDTAALREHKKLCVRTGADACLVIHHDQIVQEWYSPNYKTPMYGMSTTKSITGLLVGMLIADGRIPSADTPVCRFIKSWCEGRRGAVTIRHLLTMTSGIPMMPDSGIGSVRNKDSYVVHLVPTSMPGTTWAYSNEGVQLLSPVLDRAAGEPIQNYARRRLFEPLGMPATQLHVYPDHAWTYADMETSARDLGRIAVLMLHDGMWNGKRIVSADWIKVSTQVSQRLNPRYGLLWWIDPEIRGYAAHGHLDTDIHIIPDLDLAVIRMQAKPFSGAAEGDYEREALQLLRRLVLTSRAFVAPAPGHD